MPRPVSPKMPPARGSASTTPLILVPCPGVSACMSNEEIGSIVVLLLILIATAHFFGYLFSRLRQPKVIGEIDRSVVVIVGAQCADARLSSTQPSRTANLSKCAVAIIVIEKIRR